MPMEYSCNDIPRLAFGFANPNHAAAMICAVAPFLWGWRRTRWVGWALSAALVAALAATFSRTGFVVLALEAAAMCKWRIENVKCRMAVLVPLALAVGGLVLWWMWPRLVLDGAILNRPRIWLAGLKLAAANPLGVGLGNSGAIASAFLLPESITVRTLVNSHLTLLAEMGVLVGGLWFAFIAAAIASGRALPRTRIAFAGLAVSAFSASIFDWHVLFDFAGMGGLGPLNFTLSWMMFAGFAGAGAVLVVRGFAWKRIGISAVAAAVAMAAAVMCGRGGGDFASPVVADGVVTWGNGPWVFHDAEWSLPAVRGFFPNGARVRIESGVVPCAEAKEVWLFGTVAEASGRFPEAAVTVVSPPEYYEPGDNVKREER